MINIKASKKLDVNRIECILQLKVNEKRPDLVWFLRNLGRWELSKGEEENMEDYLEYLNLIRGGELTQDGEKAIETGLVMVPEAGLYELLCVQDPTFGNRIIHYQPRLPRDILEGNTEDFPEYETYDQKLHLDLIASKKSSEDFWIKFQKQRGEKPKVIRSGTYDAKLDILHENGQTKLKFLMNQNNVKIEHEEKLPNFNAEQNLSEWLKDWDTKIAAFEISYEEIKEHPAALNNFRTTFALEGKTLFLSKTADTGDWEVKMSVPIVPKNKKDADQWIYHLISERLASDPRYISLTKIEELERDIIEHSPIHKKFDNYFQPGKKLIDKMKDEKDDILYHMTMAAEDLLPKLKDLEVEP